jgi:transcriptional regulator with XRE-family HTH domain
MALFGYFLPATGVDRRHGGRRKLSLLARGSHHDGTGIDVRIHNISGTGLLFESDIKLAAGDRIEIELPHAGDITAVVIWASGRHFGCQFEGPVSRATLSAVELKSATDTAGSAEKAAEEVAAEPASDETFGDRLQRLRTEAKLDLGEVATRMGLSAATIASWEKGRVRPKRSRMATLADILGVETAELLDEPTPGGLETLIERHRRQIARAIGLGVGKVRIFVEF